MKVLAFGMPPTILSAPPLFVYGSLCHPKVIDTLLGRNVLEGSGEEGDQPPDGGWVQLQDGWARHCVRNHLFPALCPVSAAPNKDTTTRTGDTTGTSSSNNHKSPVLWGRLFCHLSPRDISILDWYEGEEYELQSISVRVPSHDLPFSLFPPHNDSAAAEVPEELTPTSSSWTTRTAQVYLWKPAYYDQIEWNKEWSYEHFCENVETYLDETVYPCREELEQQMDDF